MENHTSSATTAAVLSHSTLQPGQQSQAQAQTQTPAVTQPQGHTLSFREKLDAGERHWIWKLSLRVLLLVLAVIGIGCLGWAVQTANSGSYYFFLDDQLLLSWALITFGVSILWTLICIFVLLLRSPPRPVHPGVAVGMDLILWLGYIPTILFAAVACVSVMNFGSDGYINSYYTQASNGTWVYNASSYTSTGGVRSCDSNSTSTYYNYYDLPYFANCTDQDAFVNSLYTATKHRAGVVLTGTVCQGLCLVLHFALFVWACVDTQRRNRSKTSGDAEKLAAEIIGKMVRDGAIVQAPGPGNRQQIAHQQWYNGQQQQQQQQPYTVHYGPPPLPSTLNQQHPALRPQPTPGPPNAHTPQSHQIVEHYGNEKGGGLGGPGPASTPISPIVEHYGNEKSAGPAHAI